MLYSDHISARESWGRILSGSILLVCTFLHASTFGRQAAPVPTPQTPVAQTPAALPAPRPAQAKTPRVGQGVTPPRAQRTAPVATPTLPPREVVTVVHRLSGWK